LWGDEVLQPIPRRIGGWVFANRLEMRARLVREVGLPAPRLLGLAGWPLTWHNARKVGADDANLVREAIAVLPGLLDHIEDLLDEGTIGGERRNAADFQIGASLRLLMAFVDLAPALASRRAGRFAAELMPDYPTGVPQGQIPHDWLKALAIVTLP
jgi:glutathione S-transferase